MVKEITAFQADDGSVHATAWQAAQHDARTKIKSLGIFNEATMNAVLQHAIPLHEALTIILDNQPPREKADA